MCDKYGKYYNIKRKYSNFYIEETGASCHMGLVIKNFVT